MRFRIRALVVGRNGISECKRRRSGGSSRLKDTKEILRLQLLRSARIEILLVIADGAPVAAEPLQRCLVAYVPEGRVRSVPDES